MKARLKYEQPEMNVIYLTPPTFSQQALAALTENECRLNLATMTIS